MGLKAAFISIGVVMMILSMRFLYISLHFLKSKTSQTLGFLTSNEHKRNVYKGGKAGRFYKDWMDTIIITHISAAAARAIHLSAPLPDFFLLRFLCCT